MELTTDFINKIANPALIGIAARILTGTDDDSNQADLCKAMYETVRDTELRERIWNCTRKQIAIDVAVTEPVYKWSYKYAIPEDCLYIIELEDDKDFTIKSGFIYTNEKNADDQINIEYVQKADVEDTDELDLELDRFDAGLKRVMAARLGAELSKTLTDKPEDQVRAWNFYEMMLDKAALANAFEDRHDRVNRIKEESTWITSRLG